MYMKKLFIVISLMLMVGVVFGNPSDLIQKRSAPQQMSLSNVDPMSAKNISATNEKLQPWRTHNMDDLGHYLSDYVRVIPQNNITDQPESLINFTKSTPQIPTSINEGHSSKPPINTSEGMVFE
jgi:hypothetical protein